MDHWVYRLRDDAPSEQVLILDVSRDKRKIRAEIEFVDGVGVGQKQSVPGNRLRVPWADVDTFDLLMANWLRLEDEHIDEVEEYASDVVY